MRFLRHKLGGGKIDETSEACAFSTIDRTSVLRNKSSVWSSHLTDTLVNNSTVTNSIINDSVICDTLITGGKIDNSQIFAELVADFALIKNSAVRAKCRIAHTARLENVHIENLTVTGDAQLLNWETYFDGKGGYIASGIWTRPPEILYLPGDLTITESTPGKVFCGCREMEITHWLKVGNRYGKTLGLSPSDVDRIRKFLTFLLDSQKNADSEPDPLHRPQS